MPAIRLIREVLSPSGRGPGNGQYALQKALRARAPQWLTVGGQLAPGEIPWFWSWEDRLHAAACAERGQPMVVGPNVLFADSRRPCRIPAERAICRAASCRMLFTESAWYAELIERHRGPANRAPLVLWPYPIDPPPGGPLPIEHDLLIYEKSGAGGQLVDRLCRRWPRHARIRYGSYQREQLWHAARRSRCCAYLSDDDRGPLALAEILLCGCPSVGIAQGAPWVVDGLNGALAASLSAEEILPAVDRARECDRGLVRDCAVEQFDPARIVGIILDALGGIAG